MLLTRKKFNKIFGLRLEDGAYMGKEAINGKVDAL
jgi:hypothetical protein